MPRSPAPPSSPSAAPDRAGDRIAKLLARAGIASRREVERMIAEGRIALDGTVVDTPATVLRSLAGVTVDGQPVAAPAPARLFLYHKPVGLLVTERDPAGRPTIYDRLTAELPRVVPVGRLDLATEGLLLLTTDGGLKRQLELPSTGVERSYRARAYGEVSQAALEELSEGVEIDGIRYGSIDANLERRTGANAWIEMTLTEGKNREVRRVLEHLGLEVSRLIRTRYGPFVLADLPPGEVGEVRQHDLIAFRQVLNGRPQAASTMPVTVVPVAVASGRAANPSAGDERTSGALPSRPERSKSPADQPHPRPGRAGPARHGAAPRDTTARSEPRGERARPSGGRGRPEDGPARQRGFGQPQGRPARPSLPGSRVAAEEQSGRRARDRHGRPGDTDARQDGRSARARSTTADGARANARSSSPPGRPGGSVADRPAGARPGRSGAASTSDDRGPRRGRDGGDRAGNARPARGAARSGDRKAPAPTRAEPGGRRPADGPSRPTPAPGAKPSRRGPPRRPR